MTLPTQMTVIEMREAGGPDVLVTGKRDVPQPRAGEVLIKVAAAGVNGPDLVQRRGHYPPPKGASDLLGLEVSGEIVAIGAAQTQWSSGTLARVHARMASYHAGPGRNRDASSSVA